MTRRIFQAEKSYKRSRVSHLISLLIQFLQLLCTRQQFFIIVFVFFEDEYFALLSFAFLLKNFIIEADHLQLKRHTFANVLLNNLFVRFLIN
jgi:hypothetical protein